MYLKIRYLLIICLLCTLTGPRVLFAKTTLVPLAFYSPETSVAFGGAITLSSPKTPKNNLAGIAYVTLKGQYMISSNSLFNWNEESWRFRGDISFSRYPDRLYSIGPDSPQEYGEYTRSTFRLYTSIQHRFGNWHIGPALHTAFFNSINIRPQPGQTPDLWIGFSKASIFGLGINAVRDHRDHPFDPRKGSFTQFSFIHYLGLSPSYSVYSQFKFDYRRYFPLAERISWAGALHFQVSGANNPYHTLPRFGDQSNVRMMRGYYSDRFRDRCLLVIQNEMRFLLSRRWTVKAFADIGQVAPNPVSLRVQSFKVTFGMGIGFFIDKDVRMPIFVEGGWSDEGIAMSVKPMAAF